LGAFRILKNRRKRFINAVVIRERVMPRKSGRLGGLAGSVVEYVMYNAYIILLEKEREREIERGRG
jgi:hypothetical protein